jgi:hypothetical protein
MIFPIWSLTKRFAGTYDGVTGCADFYTEEWSSRERIREGCCVKKLNVRNAWPAEPADVYLNLFFPAFLVLYLYAHLLSPKRSKRGEEVLHVTLRSVLKKDIYYCHDLEPAKVAFRYCSLIKNITSRIWSRRLRSGLQKPFSTPTWPTALQKPLKPYHFLPPYKYTSPLSHELLSLTTRI